jgi:hypothetical protein
VPFVSYDTADDGPTGADASDHAAACTARDSAARARSGDRPE